MSKVLTPLNEVNNSEFSEERISFALVLPDYAPTEAIMVNIPRLKRIAQLSRLKRINIANYSGEITSYTPEVDGIDDRGTATSSARGTTTIAEAQKTTVTDASNGANGFPAFERSVAKIDVNQEELEEEILREKESLRDPKAWSKRLDKVLRSGLRESAHESLIVGKRPGFSVVSMVGVPEGFVLFGLPTGLVDGIAKAGAGIAFAHTTAQASNAYRASARGIDMKDYRKSAFFWAQYDRYLAASAICRTTKLVLPAKS